MTMYKKIFRLQVYYHDRLGTAEGDENRVPDTRIAYTYTSKSKGEKEDRGRERGRLGEE